VVMVKGLRKVYRRAVGEAAQTLLEGFPVHDLTIEELDLEEALRGYFREAG